MRCAEVTSAEEATTEMVDNATAEKRYAGSVHGWRCHIAVTRP